ncbi:MAG TPA: YfhO family protein [Chitinophagaceae bacterium]|nr:YfhO family protein [Chitinophagaceae bacterium]
MKNSFIKKALPHVVAVLIFLVVALFFCRPALEGNVLNQHDVLGWKGMAQNAFDYNQQHGYFPLWNPNVFSGMPNYQIIMGGESSLPDFQKLFTFGLPDPIYQFFIAALCFYILCLVLGLHPVIGILGGLAYTFSTYNPVIISAGHMTKILAIAYMPLLIAGLLLIYTKRYWAGLGVTTLAPVMQISSNHPQISYYLFIIAAAITIAYVITWIRQKEWKHFAIAFGLTAIAAIAAIAACSFPFFTAAEYAKATIRGGKSISIAGDSVKTEATKGLDTSYAFQYSFSKAEPLVALMPNAFGGSSSAALEDGSRVISHLTQKGIPEANAAQVAGGLPRYWGGLESTAGPAYMGAVICILALLGFVLIKHPLRWALLAVSVLSILMSWGKYFPGFNVFLFETLPAYNKFRAPSMALVMLQAVLPVVAVLTLHEFFFAKNSKENLRLNFKKILYTSGGLLLFLGLVYLVLDYRSSIDNFLAMQFQSMGANDDIISAILNGLKAERKAMFGGQVLRTAGFAFIVVAVIWLYMKNQLKAVAATAILAAVLLIDLIVIDSKYLNENNYESKDEQLAQNFTKTAIDNEILKDSAISYRVYNAGPDRFSASDYRVSPFHKAIGGYHPAKLRLYQDVIERYLSGGLGNQQVLNMLNTKYVIAQNPQNGQQVLMPNPEAYGPVWLVKQVQVVPDDVAEIQAIGNTSLKDTAIVQQSFAAAITQPQTDSTATIRLTSFTPDTLDYAYHSNTPQFAVFSEVYYPMGWNVYVDDKKADYVKTNYVLRGMMLPAGQHSIRFVFEPAMYKKAKAISYAGGLTVLAILAVSIFMSWRAYTRRKKGETKTV